MVAVAHGFTGTMDSGGAAELIRRLAGAGIAAVRVDFDPYLTPEKNSDPSNRACEYTLRDMEDDMTLALQYACSHYRIDENRLGVYGRSMGGRVAMMMANESYGGFEYQAMALVAPAGNDRAMIYFMGGQQNWENMKAQAAADGYVQYKQLRLRPDWFTQFEDYDPCAHGDSFGDKPVLVICNTLDHVVTDETSRQCAAAYENSRVIEVTTEDGHGYEMSRKDSDLKDMLMDEIVAHFAENLS
ncbi:MAG: alpha/beta hydrolase family protein [Anaerovoracaceae bacterium]